MIYIKTVYRDKKFELLLRITVPPSFLLHLSIIVITPMRSTRCKFHIYTKVAFCKIEALEFIL